MILISISYRFTSTDFRRKRNRGLAGHIFTLSKAGKSEIKVRLYEISESHNSINSVNLFCKIRFSYQPRLLTFRLCGDGWSIIHLHLLGSVIKENSSFYTAAFCFRRKQLQGRALSSRQQRFLVSPWVNNSSLTRNLKTGRHPLRNTWNKVRYSIR